MHKIIIGVLVVLGLSVLLLSCERRDIGGKKSAVERFADSFQDAPEKILHRVQVIVSASKKNDYPLALNELAMLLATNQISQPQRVSINLLMRRLRYDMEDEEFGDRVSPVMK